MESLSDAELVARSVDRADEFETIFDRHFATILRHLRFRVGDDAAEDIAAETFTRAFRARRSYDPLQPSALPWLYGIAANLIRMHWRSERRRLRAYGRVVERDRQPGSFAELEARLDAAALAPALGAALASLPVGQREVLLLHACADLSNAEIAVALTLPPGAVRKRLHRARGRVAGLLAIPEDDLPTSTTLEASPSS